MVFEENFCLKQLILENRKFDIRRYVVCFEFHDLLCTIYNLQGAATTATPFMVMLPLII